MNRVLIDTNIYTNFKKDNQPVAAHLNRIEQIMVNNIVLGELYAGFKNGSKEKRNREELEIFLDRPRIHLINTDEITAEFYAEIHAQLRHKGTPIPTNDMWIAATAMQYGVALYSLDQHFTQLEGLMLFS